MSALFLTPKEYVRNRRTKKKDRALFFLVVIPRKQLTEQLEKAESNKSKPEPARDIISVNKHHLLNQERTCVANTVLASGAF